MSRRPTIRDNASRFRKTATVAITKQLKRIENEMRIDLVEDISKTLLNKYKDNVELSYGPRNPVNINISNESDGTSGDKDKSRTVKTSTYEHLGLFLKNIDTKYENNAIKIIIKKEKYPTLEGSTKKEVTTEEVYNFLRYGTKGGGTYPYAVKVDPKTGKKEFIWAYNYPTPAHLFEEHTQNYMNSYIETLKKDIKSGKYIKQKRR